MRYRREAKARNAFEAGQADPTPYVVPMLERIDTRFGVEECRPAIGVSSFAHACCVVQSNPLRAK